MEDFIDPQGVFFTFSRVRPKFSCGRKVVETLDDIRCGRVLIEKLPRITLLFDGQNYFSLNNRRLFVYKQLREEGFLRSVPVRIKGVPSTKRMQLKYTPEKCSLTARLMPEGEHDDHPSDDDVEEGSEGRCTLKNEVSEPSVSSQASVRSAKKSLEEELNDLKADAGSSDEDTKKKRRQRKK